MTRFLIYCLLIFFIFLWHGSKGQDGSDINYVKTKNIDNSFVGKEAHLDFYNRSFRGQPVDTVIIKVGKNRIKFTEHRKDNGYNNWFSQQYLESLDTAERIFRIIGHR